MTTEIDSSVQKFLAEGENFDIRVQFETDRAIPVSQLYLDMYDGRNVPVLSMPFSEDKKKELQAGKHEAVFCFWRLSDQHCAPE